MFEDYFEDYFQFGNYFLNKIVFKIVSNWKINLKITLRKVTKIVLVDAFTLRSFLWPSDAVATEQAQEGWSKGIPDQLLHGKGASVQKVVSNHVEVGSVPPCTTPLAPALSLLRLFLGCGSHLMHGLVQLNVTHLLRSFLWQSFSSIVFLPESFSCSLMPTRSTRCWRRCCRCQAFLSLQYLELVVHWKFSFSMYYLQVSRDF